MESIRNCIEVWPLSADIYALLDSKNNGGGDGVFNDLSRQIFFAKSFIELYDKKVSAEEIPALLRDEEFSPIVKPLCDAFEIMDSDGAFDVIGNYSPSPELLCEVLKLVNRASGLLLSYSYQTRIQDSEVLDELHRDLDGVKRSERAKKSKRAKLEKMFKHDLLKYYLSCKGNFKSKLNAAQDSGFQLVAREIESSLKMVPHTLGNFERHIYDSLRFSEEQYESGELKLKDEYHSKVRST